MKKLRKEVAVEELTLITAVVAAGGHRGLVRCNDEFDVDPVLELSVNTGVGAQ